MKRLTFLSACIFLLAFTLLYSCSKEPNTTSESDVTTKMAYYDTDSDGPGIFCCIDFIINGRSRPAGASTLTYNCDLTFGQCAYGHRQGSVEEFWYWANEPLDDDHISGSMEWLDENTLIIAIDKFGSEKLENLAISDQTFTISEDMILKLTEDDTLLLLEGTYQLYHSTSEKHKYVTLIDVKKI